MSFSQLAAGRQVPSPAFVPPPVLRRAALPLALIAVWQIGVATGLIAGRTLPAPSTIAASFWTLMVTGQLWPNLLVSLARVLVGLGFGVAIGGALGLATGL